MSGVGMLLTLVGIALWIAGPLLLVSDAGPARSVLGNVAFGCGLVAVVLTLVGYIGAVLSAFRGSIAWGIVILVFSPAVLVWCFLHWFQGRLWFWIFLGGQALLGVALMFAYLAEGGKLVDLIRPELVLVPGLVLLAVIVGFLPAVTAYRTDVAKSLQA
jgi:hypothetical protein